MPNDAQLAAVEKIVGESIRRECQAFNRRVPEVIVIANEGNPALAAQLLRVHILSGLFDIPCLHLSRIALGCVAAGIG